MAFYRYTVPKTIHTNPLCREKRKGYIRFICQSLISALIFVLVFAPNTLANSLIIGQYEIPFSQATTPESVINACLAAMYMNQTVVYPGEVFSFNQAVGKRTPERYFVPAPITSLSKNTIYEYGGGICMTSSTLHQAVKNAKLKVVERHNHVTPVKYLSPGEDAAIYWGIQDYKFKNTLNNPVRINAIFTDNDCLKIELREEKAD
jgi:vancomycin resistance protein YoaR